MRSIQSFDRTTNLLSRYFVYPGSDNYFSSPKRLINTKSLLSRKSWGMPNGIYTVDLVDLVITDN